MIVSSSCDFPTRGVLYYEFGSLRFFFFLYRLVKVKEFRSVSFVSFFLEVRSVFQTFFGQRNELDSPRQRIFGKVSIVLSENEV